MANWFVCTVFFLTTSHRPLTTRPMLICALFLQSGGKMYDILWGAVFGFACLNILGLVAKQFEPGRTRITLGEMLAITAAVVSVLMLGWELLFLFHVLPIRLEPR